jgi:four helix bundle protein
MTDYEQQKAEFRKRTKQYASTVVRAYCALPKRTECQVIGRQFIRSGTAVAAIYREASRARSPAEFVAKIDLCSQEADETMLWIELLREDCKITSKDMDWLHSESDELIAIFTTMSRNTKRNMK